MRIATAKVKDLNNARNLKGRSSVEGSKEEGVLCSVRVRADTIMFLTHEQREAVEKGDFELTNLGRVKFDDDRAPTPDEGDDLP